MVATNNTMYGNSAGSVGGSVHSAGDVGSAYANNIMWGNTAPSSPELSVAGTPPTVENCCVTGGAPGSGNFDANPQFVDVALLDLHLLPTSPCIDTGNDAALRRGTRSPRRVRGHPVASRG